MYAYVFNKTYYIIIFSAQVTQAIRVRAPPVARIISRRGVTEGSRTHDNTTIRITRVCTRSSVAARRKSKRVEKSGGRDWNNALAEWKAHVVHFRFSNNRIIVDNARVFLRARARIKNNQTDSGDTVLLLLPLYRIMIVYYHCSCCRRLCPPQQ